MIPAVLADPVSLAVCVLAVALVGLSKGGLAGIGVLGVPLMALVMSPVQAAGILLPILLVSDAFSLWSWWKHWDLTTLRLMLPGAMVGIAVGWITAAFVSDAAVRLIVGAIAVAFVLRWMFQGKARRDEARPHRAGPAGIWGFLAGYTSFVAHAGGPPYQVYTMPLRQTPQLLTGTSVVFFAIVNAVKVVPYGFLGQFDVQNLAASLFLTPVIAVFTVLGAWIIRRLSARVFYPFAYAMVMLVGLKLIWDGATGL